MDKVLFQSDLQLHSVGVFEDFYFKVSPIRHGIEYFNNEKYTNWFCDFSTASHPATSAPSGGESISSLINAKNR